jgi:uncharacterized cupredoxin-like copper-binding protein
MRRNRSIYVMAAAAVAAACGGDLNESSGSSMIDTVGGEVGVSSTMASTTLNEWAIGIPSDTLPAGELTFRVVNSGTMHHALEVEGQDIERKTEPLDAGARAELTVNLKPGTYELYCPLEGPQGKHASLGMRREIVVR